MANEVTYTGQGDNLRAAEVFNSLIWDLVYDRTDLRQLCVKLGDLGGSGSAKLETPQVDWNLPMAAANVDEVTAAGNTAITDSALSLTVAQQIIAFEISDLMSVTGGAGNLDLARLAEAVSNSYSLRFTDQVCAVIDGFSSTVGTTTVDMTVDDFYAAMFTLEQAVVSGPYAAVLYPTQFTDLQESLRSEGGALQFHAPTAELLAIKGPGFAGSFLGVDIWKSDSVVASGGGGDSEGAMFGVGAVVYAEASASGSLPGSIAAPAMSPVYAEFERVADPGLCRVIGHAFNAVAIGEDARGVSIITDR
jgi:hypothetical protein